MSAAALVNSRVLVLNRAYQPIHITNLKRAMCMLYLGVARALDDEFQLWDFQSWADLSAREHDHVVSTPRRLIRAPKIIVLQAFYRMPIGRIRFSRQNIYARDQHTCQYCGHRFAKHQLNFDHVKPRSQGGKTSWENVVTSCIPCNTKKGGRTPEQAGMKLLKPARQPTWKDLGHLSRWGGSGAQAKAHKEWLPFLSNVDAAYWHTELDHDE